MPSRLSKGSSHRGADRLRLVSEGVSRIASRWPPPSATAAPAPTPIQPTTAGDLESLSAERVRKVIRARRLRARYFPQELFADPAWDMLLDLLQAEIAQQSVPVSSLSIASAVPATTALRWLRAMVSQGILIRHADPLDGRRVFVELAPETSRALRLYFAEVAQMEAVQAGPAQVDNA